jgi:sialic acid synthase SpsE
MCGTSKNSRRIIDEKETTYLESLYRGLYLKNDIKKNQKITTNDLYSAIPYQKELEQLTSRDFIEEDAIATKNLKKDAPLVRGDF